MLQCTKGQLDYQSFERKDAAQPPVARVEEDHRVFRMKWANELDRYVVFLRDTQRVYTSEHGTLLADGVQRVWPPDYVSADDKGLFMKGVRVGCKIVWEALRKRIKLAGNRTFVSLPLVAQLLRDELHKEKAYPLIRVEEDKRGDIGSIGDEFAKLAESDSVYLKGIMAACRFCRWNRIGTLLQDKRVWNDQMKSAVQSEESVKDKMRMFGVLACLCFLGEKAHRAWSSNLALEPILEETFRIIVDLGEGGLGRWPRAKEQKS